MRLVLIITLGLWLTGSALPLAVAPPVPASMTLAACDGKIYADSAGLLADLPGASYACVEALAGALRLHVRLDDVDRLLAMVRDGAHDRERRNALRVLGRLAESRRGSLAHELVVRARAAAVQAHVRELLANQTDNFLLQDAIWLLDTFFYPNLSAAPVLERVARQERFAPALRFRAAAARGRLVFARPGPLAAVDRAFILDGLRSADPGVRAAAGLAAARLRDIQLDEATSAMLDQALAAAWAAEPPLALAPDAPDPRAAGLLSFQESSPTSLTARAAIARARDHIAGGEANFAQLKATFTALALPYQQVERDVILKFGVHPDQFPVVLAEVERVRELFIALAGPGLAQPIRGEGERPLTILIFARQGVYRDYMRAFTAFSVDVDGIYDEATATLFTYQRTPVQSENTLIETLRHEVAHHYMATHIFPDGWLSPGYHTEPKGWADEGLAEVMAGLGPNGPAPRPAQLARLCAGAAPPSLTDLLAQRAGYDRFGHFDYAHAWAFSAYLLAERPAALRRIYAAYRDGSYRLAAWERIAGLRIHEAEAEWHLAIGRWCGIMQPYSPTSGSH